MLDCVVRFATAGDTHVVGNHAREEPYRIRTGHRQNGMQTFKRHDTLSRLPDTQGDTAEVTANGAGTIDKWTAKETDTMNKPTLTKELIDAIRAEIFRKPEWEAVAEEMRGLLTGKRRTMHRISR